MATSSAVEPGCAVELLAQDVDLPGVPGGLLDHVHVDPAQRYRPEPTMRHHVIEGITRGDPAGLLALRLIPGYQCRQCFLGQELELPGAIVRATVVVASSLQKLIDPAVFGPTQVLDQPA